MVEQNNNAKKIELVEVVGRHRIFKIPADKKFDVKIVIKEDEKEADILDRDGYPTGKKATIKQPRRELITDQSLERSFLAKETGFVHQSKIGLIPISKTWIKLERDRIAFERDIIDQEVSRQYFETEDPQDFGDIDMSRFKHDTGGLSKENEEEWKNRSRAVVQEERRVVEGLLDELDIDIGNEEILEFSLVLDKLE